MADFDAELYLRLVGERMVLGRGGDGRSSGWSSPIVEIASALVAIGVLPLDEAQTIARDYEMALAMRGNQRSMGGMFRNTARAAKASGKPLDEVRVLRCSPNVTTRWGSITPHYALLSSDQISVAITAIESRPSAQGMQALAGTFKDDKGNSAQGHFSGGGGGNTYRGRLDASGLDPMTDWLELDGQRIELHEPDTVPRVEVEQLPPSSPAHRHLWKLLAGSMSHGPRRVDPASVESIIDVFIAANAVEPDDPVLNQIRAVVHAVSTGDRSSADLPQSWKSILSRTRGPFHGGPDGEGETRTVLVGSSALPIDGVYLRVNALVLTGRQLAASVSVSPGSALGSWGPSLGGSEVAWWAEDDRGNHYIGSVGSSGGSPDRGDGVVNFTPPLANGATSISLRPTADTERVVITIGLDEEGQP